jgi:hypothetical protein
MTQFNAPSYDIQRPTGQCAFSGQTLEPGSPYVATLIEVDPVDEQGNPKPGEPTLKRLDVSTQAWESGQRPQRLFSYWRSIVPQPNQKKKVFVDDDVLVNLFRRLGDDDQQQRVAFRFVLCLVLMRKRLLRYDGTDEKANPADPSGDKQAWWKVTIKGDEQPTLVLDPKLGPEQVQQVTEQLGEILEGQL